MQDYKTQAAGDSRETSEQSEMKSGGAICDPPSPNSVDAEHAEIAAAAIAHLQAKYLITLSPEDVKVWKSSMLKIPIWKIARIDEFSGDLRKIWAFFDTLQAPPKVYHMPQLPEPKSQVGKDFFAHVRLLTEDKFKPTVWHSHNPEEYERQRAEWLKAHREKERLSLQSLHAKHPHAGFDKTIRAREL